MMSAVLQHRGGRESRQSLASVDARVDVVALSSHVVASDSVSTGVVGFYSVTYRPGLGKSSFLWLWIRAPWTRCCCAHENTPFLKRQVVVDCDSQVILAVSYSDPRFQRKNRTSSSECVSCVCASCSISSFSVAWLADATFVRPFRTKGASHADAPASPQRRRRFPPKMWVNQRFVGIISVQSLHFVPPWLCRRPSLFQSEARILLSCTQYFTDSAFRPASIWPLWMQTYGVAFKGFLLPVKQRSVSATEGAHSIAKGVRN